jgi:hypothetical protein
MEFQLCSVFHKVLEEQKSVAFPSDSKVYGGPKSYRHNIVKRKNGK